jgi:hypothetical protein
LTSFVVPSKSWGSVLTVVALILLATTYSLGLTPQITAISPSSAAAGSSSFTLAVQGRDFNRYTTVLWNGSSLMTTYISSTTLRASISSTHIQQAGQSTIAVYNSHSRTTSNAIIFFVTAATAPLGIATTSLSNATSGTAYSATLAATGGQSPYSWAIASGTLPSGITLSAAGVFAGTPSQNGTFNFTVSATDSEATPKTVSQSLSLVVQAAMPALSIITTSLSNATSGTGYSATLAATGGQSPYTWAIASGTLPSGITLSAAGVLAGTPSQSGTFNFTVSATDSENTPKVANQSLSLLVAAPPLSITTSSLPNGTEGSPYDATVSATGGTPPYTWSISSGSLPSTVTLAATSGNISGTPSTSGTFTPILQVTDSVNNHVQLAYSFTISQAGYSVLLSWSASPSSGVNGYNVYRTAAGGGGYAKINGSSVTGLSYTDTTVVDGQIYYYAVTSLDASGDESAYSADVQMNIP